MWWHTDSRLRSKCDGTRTVDCVWNVMARAQKPDVIFRRNERVHLNRRGRQFSRLLAAEVCASAVVMLDTPCSEVVWRVLATHSIRQFPINFPSRASPCAIRFQLDSTKYFWFVRAHTNMWSHLMHNSLVHQYKVLFRQLYFSLNKSFEIVSKLERFESE
jgi:hypothetical protein